MEKEKETQRKAFFTQLLTLYFSGHSTTTEFFNKYKDAPTH